MSGGPYLSWWTGGLNSSYPYPLSVSVSWRGATNAPERIFMSGRKSSECITPDLGRARIAVVIRAAPIEWGRPRTGADANKEVGGEPVDPAVTCIPLYGGQARIVHRNPHPMV